MNQKRWRAVRAETLSVLLERKIDLPTGRGCCFLSEGMLSPRETPRAVSNTAVKVAGGAPWAAWHPPAAERQTSGPPLPKLGDCQCAGTPPFEAAFRRQRRPCAACSRGDPLANLQEACKSALRLSVVSVSRRDSQPCSRHVPSNFVIDACQVYIPAPRRRRTSRAQEQ